MKKTITAIALGASLISACGQKEVIREVLVTTPTTEAPQAPEANKYDSYLEALYNNSAQARTWSEGDLLELGTLVCQTFDNGRTLDQVITIFSNNSEGTYDDELYSAVIAGSVTFLCPEWASYVQQMLN